MLNRYWRLSALDYVVPMVDGDARMLDIRFYLQMFNDYDSNRLISDPAGLIDNTTVITASSNTWKTGSSNDDSQAQLGNHGEWNSSTNNPWNVTFDFGSSVNPKFLLFYNTTTNSTDNFLLESSPDNSSWITEQVYVGTQSTPYNTAILSGGYHWYAIGPQTTWTEETHVVNYKNYNGQPPHENNFLKKPLYYHRGTGYIKGTPQEGGVYINKEPVRRIVELWNENPRKLLSFQWSTNGAFLFTGLNPTMRYTIIARDLPSLEWNAVIADAIYPTVDPV